MIERNNIYKLDCIKGMAGMAARLFKEWVEPGIK